MNEIRNRCHTSLDTVTQMPGRTRLKVAMVSTLPPRQCGIATFASNLCAAISDSGASVRFEYVAIEHQTEAPFPVDGICRIAQGDRTSFLEAAQQLNHLNVDVVCVQHEFGLYGTWEGGAYRDHLGPFLAVLRAPAVCTLHTVLPAPAPSLLVAIQGIASHSAALIVMSDGAARLLSSVYGVDPGKIRVVPHGVPAMAHADPAELRERFDLVGRTVISTFGLVDPRKGIEFMLEAMETVAARHPEAIYLVLGRTHPELLAREGEEYRNRLRAMIRERGIEDQVRMVDEYLSEQEIVDYLAVTDVYVTPYLDPDQITSGTLAYALGAGKAVVSTSYLHAIGALAEERGLLVGFRSGPELASAVLRIVEDPALRQRIEANAYAVGRHSAWPMVAVVMESLLQNLAEERWSTALRPLQIQPRRTLLLNRGRS